MSEQVQPTTPNNNYKTFVLPELGVSVQARTLEEAITKGKKSAKENKQ